MKFVNSKQLKMHGCVISNAATDASVLKHWGISIPSADEIPIALDQCHTRMLHNE